MQQLNSTLIAQVNLTNLLYAHIVSCVACMWVAQPLRLIPLYENGLKKNPSRYPLCIYLSMAPSIAFLYQYLGLTLYVHIYTHITYSGANSNAKC